MTGSPVPYYGSKATVAADIAALFPDHRRYVEPYAGSLAVMLAKPPARHEVVNDIDADIMTFWSVLRDHPHELSRACMLTPHSRVERQRALDRPADLTDLERARRVWVALCQGRNGTLCRTGWRHDLRSDSFPMPSRLRTFAARIDQAAERLRAVTLESMPALDIIRRYGNDRGTLIYCDPPYLGAVRSTGYRHEMTSDDEHRELHAVLADCPATVILSGYGSPLYDRLYRGWHRVELPAHTTQGTGASERVEVLWSNREFRHSTPETVPLCDETCARCGRVIPRRHTGRPATWCSPACRTAAWRERRSDSEEI